MPVTHLIGSNRYLCGHHPFIQEFAPYIRYKGELIESYEYGASPRTRSPCARTQEGMGQSRVGLQGNEPLYGDWSAVFQVETFSTLSPATSPAR